MVWYNSSVEQFNGGLKGLAFHRALRRGRPHRWRAEDVSEARRFEGKRVRADGTTSEGTFAARTPLTSWERSRFGLLAERCERRARQVLGLNPGEDLGPRDLAKVRRRALAWALEKSGLLFFRSRRITPGKRNKNRARIYVRVTQDLVKSRRKQVQLPLGFLLRFHV